MRGKFFLDQVKGGTQNVNVCWPDFSKRWEYQDDVVRDTIKRTGSMGIFPTPAFLDT